MAASNIDVITQRQQARKTHFYEASGARKSSAPKAIETEKTPNPDYKVEISQTARKAALGQNQTVLSKGNTEMATQATSPNASKLAELKAKSDEVMGKYNSQPQASTEPVTKDSATETAAVESLESEAPEKSMDLISKRQAERQEYFHSGEKAQQFEYNRNEDLDRLRAQSDAVINGGTLKNE